VRFRAAFDGGSRGNPGHAAWAVAVFDERGRYVEGHAGTLGRATNNVAEYHGLIESLRLAARQGAREVEVASDSELIVRQILGQYRVRNPDLQLLHRQAMELIAAFPVFRIRHVRREDNREADGLVNRALDRAAADAAEAEIRLVDRPETAPPLP
jgi:ribonuclease HI